MVIMSTRADDVSTQEVSPESILGASAAQARAGRSPTASAPSPAALDILNVRLARAARPGANCFTLTSLRGALGRSDALLRPAWRGATFQEQASCQRREPPFMRESGRAGGAL